MLTPALGAGCTYGDYTDCDNKANNDNAQAQYSLAQMF